MKKLRALLLAESCNPEWVSVPLVGWHHCEALHRLTDEIEVKVVTQVRNRDAFLRQGWREGADFCPIDTETVARAVRRVDKALRRALGLGWTANSALAAIRYARFEQRVWQTFGPSIE